MFSIGEKWNCMMKIQQHRPAYFEGFENEVAEFNNMEELAAIPWVKGFSESANFHGFFGNSDINSTTLIALYDYDEKYGGCKKIGRAHV